MIKTLARHRRETLDSYKKATPEQKIIIWTVWAWVFVFFTTMLAMVMVKLFYLD